MTELNPATSFRGLPLTLDQEGEIAHYIHARQRCGVEWNTSELRAMIADMLNPPEISGDDAQSLGESMAAEITTAFGEETLDDDRERPGRDQHGHQAHG